MAIFARCAFAVALAVLGHSAAAQHAHSDQSAAPYAGLQVREIKSLSEEDIADLRAGRGWGLALPAELNGRPGPAHVLEHRVELELSAEQVGAVTEIYELMRDAAVAAGARFIAAEAALDDAFANGQLDNDALAQLLAESEAARKELRLIHLSAHLSTPPLLTDAQIKKYNVLRGYAADPCAAVPEGHDPAMWRRHNGCD